MRSLKNGIIATLALALVLTAFPAAALVASWSTPVNLSSSGEDARDPQVVVDSTGLAIAVWGRANGSYQIIQSSTRSSGGNWSAAVDVSNPFTSSWHYAFHPQITVDSSGLATAIWVSYDDTDSVSIIQSSRLPRGGSWSIPENLSAADGFASDPKLTVNSTGLVTAIWITSDDSDNIIIQSSTSQSGGDWSEPVDTVLTGDRVEGPQVVADSSGLVTAIWTSLNFVGDTKVVQSSKLPVNGVWSIPVNLSGVGVEARYPQVAVDSTGLITAIWSGDGIIQSRTSQGVGDWSTSTADLIEIGQVAYSPQVVADSSGLVTAIWQRDNGTHYIIQSSTRPSGGAWSEPVDLSEIGQSATNPYITVDSSGLVTAIWQRNNGTHSIIQSSTRPSGGAWSEPFDLSEIGRNASESRVTLGSTGLVTAIWKRFNGSHNIIQSSYFGGSITTPTPTPTQTPTQTPTPTLATTGSNLEWLPLASVLVLVAGVALFVFGNRRLRG